jgi:hypothetical protein
MDRRMAQDLDRHITGNYGEDQLRDDQVPCEKYGCYEVNTSECEYCGSWFCPTHLEAEQVSYEDRPGHVCPAIDEHEQEE